MVDEAREPLSPVAKPGQKAAAVLAVAVHVLLALFLIYGIRWQSSFPEAVEVELVRSVPTPAPKKSPEPVKEPEPRPEPPKPKSEPKPEPVKPPPKPDIAVKEKEKPKPEKKPEPKFDPIQEALKKEMEQARRQQMSNAASQELSQMQAASAAQSKSKSAYVDRIRNKIRGNLVVPLGVQGNPEAEFRVTQLPSGEVHEVRLTKSSGNKMLDEAIERAINKSSPLPNPERPADFSRVLELKFRPLEQM